MADFQEQYNSYMNPKKSEKVKSEKKGKGCLFYGCLTVFILLLIIGGCTPLSGNFMIKTAKEYTSTEPMEIARYEPQPME